MNSLISGIAARSDDGFRHRCSQIPVIAALLVLLVLPLGAQSQEPLELSLLTYNMHSETSILDPMIAIIREAEADIVNLVEVRPETYAHFQAEFSADYAYIVGPPPDQPWRPLMLMSRYEVLEYHYYPTDNMRLLRAVIEVGSQQITVFSAYPDNPTGNGTYDSNVRNHQITYLLEQVAQETGPVIMLGDFNTEEWSDDYEALTVDYIDAFRSLHPEALGATFPDYSTPQSRVNIHLPRWTPLILRIDYVFHDPTITALDARVWPDSGGSDHRPLFVRVSLPSAD